MLHQRIQHRRDGRKGSIRYIGKIANVSGTRLGIEWDNPSPQRHDGIFEGIRYFSCSEGKGSFVKPSAVIYASEFDSAVEEKYFRQCEIDAAIISLETSHHLSTPSDIIQISLQSHAVTLQNSNRPYPNLKSLYLSQNLISSWKSVLYLSGRCTQLEELYLDSNHLIWDISETSSAFTNLKILSLSNVPNALTCLRKLSAMLQLEKLTDVYLRENEISSLEEFREIRSSSLCVLDLSNNAITCTDQLDHLHHLNLNRILLNWNKIRTNGKPTNSFDSLKVIEIQGNPIDSFKVFIEWSDWMIFPNLKQLRAQKTLLEDTLGPRQLRSRLIALFPSISLLNKSQITQRERLDAELEACSLSNNLFSTQRLIQLRQKHNWQPVTVRSKLNSIINLQIESFDGSFSVNKKIPQSISVLKLSLIVSKISKVQSVGMRLFLCSEDNRRIEELVDPQKTLQHFGVTEGDRIKFKQTN